MSPLLRENGRAPVAYVGGTNSLSWNFIGFPRKPSYSASFLHWISLLSYPYLTTLYIFNSIISWSPMPSPLRIPWIHRGWTPAHWRLAQKLKRLFFFRNWKGSCYCFHFSVLLDKRRCFLQRKEQTSCPRQQILTQKKRWLFFCTALSSDCKYIIKGWPFLIISPAPNMLSILQTWLFKRKLLL